MAQVSPPSLTPPGRYRFIVFARQHDRHEQADTLGRQDFAPLREKLLEGFPHGANVAVEIIQPARVYATSLLAEGHVPVDLVRERVPSEANDGYTVVANPQDIGPLLPEPVHCLTTIMALVE